MPSSPGRPRTISPDTVSLVALRLFDERGFDAVSMDDIAAEADVSRRSLFRLFPSKSSLVSGGLDEFVARFRGALEAGDQTADALDALRSAYLVASAFPDDQLEVTRRRLCVIRATPALDLRADPRLTVLTDDIHRFLVDRGAEGDLAGFVRAHALSAIVSAALTWWAEHDDGRPEDVLARAFAVTGMS